jgi:imidazolonepropionase-like amidohydrolase
MTQTLFTNATLVLDGFTELQPSFNVLVRDSRIVSVSAKPIDAPEAAVVDVGGRTLIPGQDAGCRELVGSRGQWTRKAFCLK